MELRHFGERARFIEPRIIIVIGNEVEGTML